MGKVMASGIFIINKENKLLVGHPTIQDKNFWSIPKGKIEAGEDSIDAAVRETLEESNIDFKYYITKMIMLPSVTYAHKKKTLIPFLIFEEDCDGLDLNKIEIKCNSNVTDEHGTLPEMDDFKWVTLDEASKLLHNTQVACLNLITKIMSER